MDVILFNGTLYDGTGAPPLTADVGISKGRIEAVGDLKNVSAQQCLDCTDMAIAPGFIDAHSHSDTYILLEPTAPSKLSQGITTEVVGNCGASAAPLLQESRLPSDWASFTYPDLESTKRHTLQSVAKATWSTFASYRTLLDSRHPSITIVNLIGHRLLRTAVMGMQPRPATSDEITAMSNHLSQALDEGAIGLSTGLLYDPARYAEPSEIESLAKIVAKRGGVYATHLRNEGAHILGAIDEALDVARRTGVALQISHMKVSGKKNWHLADDVIEKINAARAEGLDVRADVYPYTAAGTELDILLPSWAEQGTPEERLRKITDTATRRKILEEMSMSGNDWGEVWVGGTWHPETHPFRGQSLESVAHALNLSPEETVLWLIERDTLRTGGFFFGMSDENLGKFLAQPWVMVGSDASLRSPHGVLSHDHPHPRAYGSHAKMLAMARQGRGLSLEETIRRMTSLPAETFKLVDRGILRKGAIADVVVFDAATIRDTATYANPHQFAEGVKAVIVEGRELRIEN